MAKIVRRLCVVSALFSAATFVQAIEKTTVPDYVCEDLSLGGCTPEANYFAHYIDLNADNVKELVVIYAGGSCGSQYAVFTMDPRSRWQQFGGWCGCDSETITLGRYKRLGYRDIYTCGVSGAYTGKKYIGVTSKDSGEQ